MADAHDEHRASRWSLPARYGANREVVALSVARLAEALGNSILTIVIPLYVAEIAHPLFNLPVPVLVGTLISLYGIVSAAVQPVMGALSDRLGRRKVQIQAGMALMGLGTLAFMAATSYSHLLVLRAIQGIGVATTIPASMAVMATATRRHTRASSMGIYSTLRLIGFAGGPVIGGFLKVRFGFDAAFIVGAAFVLLAMILVQVWVRETPPAEPAAPPAPGRLRILDRDLLDPGILAAALATLLMAANFSMVTTLENEFNARLDMTAFEFGIAFAMVMVSRLVFQVPVGRLADTIGRKPLMLGGLLVLAPATGLLGYVTSPAQLMAVRFLQGCGGAGIAAPAFAVAGDLAREGGEGRQMSLVTTGFGLGMTIGPLIAGPLSLFFFQLPFLVGGALALAGLWAVYRYMPETVAGGRGWFRSAAPEKVSDRNAG